MGNVMEWFREKEKQLKKAKYTRPFGEWRIPVMLVCVSSLVFVMLTAMFGISINRGTGELAYNMDGIQNVPDDPWSNPMTQYPDYCYIVMIFGYYVTIGFMIVGWYDYCKWKWNNIPVEMRYEEKEMQVRQRKKL